MNVEELKEKHGDAKNHEEGTHFVSDVTVCESNAGFFVGRQCITSVCGMWLVEVYSRDSEYMSEDDARRRVAHYHEVLKNTPMSAQGLVDIIRPEHDRTSCSDEYLVNAGRCSRCTLLRTIKENKALDGINYGESV